MPCTFAFVDFPTHERAAAALARNSGCPLPDQPSLAFKLNWASGGGLVDDQRRQEWSIFVGDLDADVTDGILLETFQNSLPSATSAKVMMDPRTNASRGYGFVRFSSGVEAGRAMAELNGTVIGSRAIRVSPATPKGLSRVSRPALQPPGPVYYQHHGHQHHQPPSATHYYALQTHQQQPQIQQTQLQQPQQPLRYPSRPILAAMRSAQPSSHEQPIYHSRPTAAGPTSPILSHPPPPPPLYNHAGSKNFASPAPLPPHHLYQQQQQQQQYPAVYGYPVYMADSGLASPLSRLISPHGMPAAGGGRESEFAEAVYASPPSPSQTGRDSGLEGALEALSVGPSASGRSLYDEAVTQQQLRQHEHQEQQQRQQHMGGRQYFYTRAFTLFVGGIDSTVQDHHLWSLFGHFGRIQSIKLFTENNNYAFVNFDRREDGERAMLALNGYMMGDSVRFKISWKRTKNAAA